MALNRNSTTLAAALLSAALASGMPGASPVLADAKYPDAANMMRIIHGPDAPSCIHASQGFREWTPLDDTGCFPVQFQASGQALSGVRPV